MPSRVVVLVLVLVFFFKCYGDHRDLHSFPTRRSSDLELNRSGLLAENEKIRPILAQLEKLLLCDLSSCARIGDRKSGSAGMPRPISYAVFCLKKKKTNTDKSRQSTYGLPSCVAGP